MSEATAGAPNVIVCIPTYRRTKQLALLLHALKAQRAAPPFLILVGNNEACDLRSHIDLMGPTFPPFQVIDVTTRGVSAVRNAMVADVLARPDPVRWIACLDDDQNPDAGWLASLIEAGEAHDADLVGGPVRRIAPKETFWSYVASDTSYLPSRSGATAMLNEAGNLLLATRFLRRLERPPFSLDYGRTGGEDYEFFLHARSLGARIFWAPEARVFEPLPADQVTFRNFVSRFFEIAAYQARADRRYNGLPFVVRRIAFEIVKAPALCARALVRDRSVKRAIGVVVQYAAITAGRLSGLAGSRSDRYGGDSQ